MNLASVQNDVPEGGYFASLGTSQKNFVFIIDFNTFQLLLIYMGVASPWFFVWKEKTPFICLTYFLITYYLGKDLFSCFELLLHFK